MPKNNMEAPPCAAAAQRRLPSLSLRVCLSPPPSTSCLISMQLRDAPIHKKPAASRSGHLEDRGGGRRGGEGEKTLSKVSIHYRRREARRRTYHVSVTSGYDVTAYSEPLHRPLGAIWGWKTPLKYAKTRGRRARIIHKNVTLTSATLCCRAGKTVSHWNNRQHNRY